MLKKIVVVVALLIISFNSYAQKKTDAKLTKSKLITEVRRNTSLVTTASDENAGLIVLKAVKNRIGLYIKEYIIEHYDSDLKLIKKVILPNKSTQIIEKMYVKDGMVYFIKKDLPFRKKIQYYGMSGSIVELKFNSKLLYTLTKNRYKKMQFGTDFTDPHEPYYYLSRASDLDTFGIVTLSKGYNFFALSFDLKNKERKEEHLFVVFDAQMNKVDEITFKSDEKDRFFSYHNIDVSDKDGTIFLLGRVYENGRLKSKVKGKSNYHYDLYKLKGASKLKVSIKEPNHFINSMSLVHNGDRLILLGFFGSKKLKYDMGACRYDLSESLTIQNRSLQLFPNQLFSDMCPDCNDLKDTKKKIKFLKVRSVFVDDEQNAVINAEQYYIKIRRDRQGNASSVVHHYDDIVTLKFDSNGKILWARNINKSQKGVKNTSFSGLFANGKNYIFLNASDRVVERDNDVIAFKRTTAKKSNLYMIVVNGNGKLKYKKMIDDKESKVWYVVYAGIADTKEKTIIFEGNKGKLRRLAKIKVD